VLEDNSTGSQKVHAADSVYGVASTKRTRDRIRNTEIIRDLPSGSVSGIHALMLDEGMIRNYDVIVLLGKTIQDTSEYGPAASVSEAIMKVPGLSCDTRSLLTKAKTYEQDLRRVRSERKGSAINLYL
jgi:predicted ATP-grasp superfamily ATP-dependent carboligase